MDIPQSSSEEADDSSKQASTESSELDHIVELLREYRSHPLTGDRSSPPGVRPPVHPQAGAAASETNNFSNIDASQSSGLSAGAASQAHAHRPVAHPPPIAQSAPSDGRAVGREDSCVATKPVSGLPDTRSMHDLSLPHLKDPNWLIPEHWKTKLCRDWESQHRCKYGKKCHYIHRHGPWGESLESIWSEMENRSFPADPNKFRTEAQYRCVVVGTKQWWTAGHRRLSYKDSKNVYYAEGGPARISSQGISWYTNKTDAYAALEKVAMVSAWAAERRRTPADYGLPPAPNGGRRWSSYTAPSQVDMARSAEVRRRSYTAPSHGDLARTDLRVNSYSAQTGASENGTSPPQHSPQTYSGHPYHYDDQRSASFEQGRQEQYSGHHHHQYDQQGPVGSGHYDRHQYEQHARRSASADEYEYDRNNYHHERRSTRTDEYDHDRHHQHYDHQRRSAGAEYEGGRHDQQDPYAQDYRHGRHGYSRRHSG